MVKNRPLDISNETTYFKCRVALFWMQKDGGFASHHRAQTHFNTVQKKFNDEVKNGVKICLFSFSPFDRVKHFKKL